MELYRIHIVSYSCILWHNKNPLLGLAKRMKKIKNATNPEEGLCFKKLEVNCRRQEKKAKPRKISGWNVEFLITFDYTHFLGTFLKVSILHVQRATDHSNASNTQPFPHLSDWLVKATPCTTWSQACKKWYPEKPSSGLIVGMPLGGLKRECKLITQNVQNQQKSEDVHWPLKNFPTIK